MGLSTADSLSRKGARVTVVDTRNGPGQGTSFSNSGMLHPSQAMPWFPVSNIRGAQTHVMRAIKVQAVAGVLKCMKILRI